MALKVLQDSLRLWYLLGGTVVSLDCENAFNSVNRTAIIAGLEQYCPALLRVFTALYCGEHLPEMRAELRNEDGVEIDMAQRL